MNPKISRNALWFALAVLVVMSISWSRSSSDLTRKRFGGLPVSGTNFASASLPLSEVERQVFLHAEVAKRLYDPDGLTVVVVGPAPKPAKAASKP